MGQDSRIEPEDILEIHFKEWCAKFKVVPTDTGFVTSSGHAVYPAHAVTETDGTVWLSTLRNFDYSGIRGHVEENPVFRAALKTAAKLPRRAPEGVGLVINGKAYQMIFQNTIESGGNHIINVAFVNKTESRL